MQRKEIVKIPKELVVETICDRCKEKIQTRGHDVDEVTIHRKKGTAYPEGGSGTEIEVDLCGECFDEWLLPILKEGKVDIRETEWDW